MKRYDVDRLAEAKYRGCVEQIVARLKGLPGDVWSQFAACIQCGEPAVSEEIGQQLRQACQEVIGTCSPPDLELLWLGSDALWKRKDEGPGSRTDWESGVLKELQERVRYAAGEGGLADERNGPAVAQPEQNFRFEADDLVFLSRLAWRLGTLTAQPGLAPKDAAAVRRVVAALKRLPQLTPGLDVQIEVSHGMGGEGFRESYCYGIKVDPQRIELSSSGTQGDPAVESNSFTLESLQWYANGQAQHQGNRDIWMERLAYALGRKYSVKVTDGPGDKGTETV